MKIRVRKLALLSALTLGAIAIPVGAADAATATTPSADTRSVVSVNSGESVVSGDGTCPDDSIVVLSRKAGGDPGLQLNILDLLEISL